MYSQFLESKLDYPSHLADWQERQNKSTGLLLGIGGSQEKYPGVAGIPG